MTFYGFPDECAKFEKRHPQWSATMANLNTSMNIAFTRTEPEASVADKLVYFFGRTVVEDFLEITLVCYHGYGVAAAKLVRSMYEFAVTLRYIHENPDEAGAFLDYHLVQQDKLMSRIIETFGPAILPAEEVAEVRGRAAKVKDQFLVPVCDHPESKMRLNHSWNKLDFVSMAQAAGDIGKLIVSGYYIPLRHAHPTLGGLMERLEVVNDRMGMKVDSQPKTADQSLMTAHNCILDTLVVQGQHFKIDGLEETLKKCVDDFIEVWAPAKAS
jgi:Family of unknown function (DUF5677)